LTALVSACRSLSRLERDAVADFSLALRSPLAMTARSLASLQVVSSAEDSGVAESCVAEFHAELAAEPLRLFLEPSLESATWGAAGSAVVSSAVPSALA
jgi:hypothetical protein